MPDPFARLAEPIPVTVSATAVAVTEVAGLAVIRMERSMHDHVSDTECPACASLGDIRAHLFDLLEDARQGRRPGFSRVIVDASALPDSSAVVDRLVPGRMPARGLRDHAVAHNFRLDPAF